MTTNSVPHTLLLFLAGPATALPMLLLLSGSKGTSMKFIGTSQYLAPSISLLVAVFLFGEPFQVSDLCIFAFIWIGVCSLLKDSSQQDFASEVLSLESSSAEGVRS